MSNSWGHALVQLSVQELFRLAQADARIGGAYFYGACTLGRVTHTTPATYRSSYNYVTGRAGRVSWADRLICPDHAVKFAAKYGIDLASVPVEKARTKHASEEVVEAFFGGAS